MHLSVAPKTSGIYAITNTTNDKQYIGSTRNFAERWQRHRELLRAGKHHSIHLQRAWKKHGEAVFAWSVLEHVADLDMLLAREQHYLDTLRPAYNRCPTAGSTRGVRLSEAHKAKMAARMRGVKNPEHSERMKGHRGWNRGMIVSEETRQKQSAAGKGRPKSEEHKRKIGLAHAGRPKSYMAERNRRLAAEKRALKELRSAKQLHLFGDD